MIDLETIRHELAQARAARIAAELAGCEVEELADSLRQSLPGWARPRPGQPRCAGSVVLGC